MSTGDEEETLTPRDWSPLLPEIYSGVFRVRRCGGKPEDGFPWTFKVDLNLPDIPINDYSFNPMPIGVTGAAQLFYDECIAYWSTVTDPPDNEDELIALVKQLAQDFVLFRAFSIDLVFIGPCAIVPVAILDYIEFAYDADAPADDDNQDDQVIEMVEDKLRPNCYTRIRSEPWSGYPERFQHWDQQNLTTACRESTDQTPAIRMLAPGPHQGGLIGTSLTLEDGRLKYDYDTGGLSPCLPCSICVNVTACGLRTEGVKVSLIFTPPIIEISGSSTGDNATANAVVTGGVITSFQVTHGGSGYTSVPTVFINLSGGNGSGASAHAIVTSGSVTSIVVDSGGSGYIGSTFGPSVNVLLPNGVISTNVATATVSGGVITAITLNSFPAGYTSTPGVSITDEYGGGHDAVIVAHLTGTTLTSITISNGGAGYGAHVPIGECTTTTQVSAITMTNQGSGYTSPPTVTFTVSGGGTTITPATGTALISGGNVVSVTINNPGSYTGITSLIIGFTGGGGSGAHGNPVLITQCCFTITVAAYYTIIADPPVSSTKLGQLARKKITNHYLCIANIVNMNLGFVYGQVTVTATDCAIRNPTTGVITNPIAGGFVFQIKTSSGTVIATVTTISNPTAVVLVGSYFVHYSSGYHFGSNPPDQSVTVGDCSPDNNKTVGFQMQPQPFFNATCPCFPCPQEFDPNGSLTLHDPSFGYTVPIATNNSGPGTDAGFLCGNAGIRWASSANVRAKAGVLSVTITNGGSGYEVPGAPGSQLAASVTFSGGSARFQARAAPISNIVTPHYAPDTLGNTPVTYKITKIDIDFSGLGDYAGGCWYLSPPTVTITANPGFGGSGATAVVNLSDMNDQYIVYGFDTHYSGDPGFPSGTDCSLTTGIGNTGSGLFVAWRCGVLLSLSCTPLNIQIDMGGGGGGGVCSSPSSGSGLSIYNLGSTICSITL